MADRARIKLLDLVAHGVGAPCLAAAFVLYFLVTWAPSAQPKRELVCASLVLAGAGANVIHVFSSSRGMRLAGATAMMMGLVAVIAIGSW